MREVFQPAKEFFSQDSRSTKIRGICLSMARITDALLHDPELYEDKEGRKQFQEELLKLRDELTELGITPFMHVGRTDPMVTAEPREIAEFVAGQLLGYAEVTVPSEGIMMSVIQEHSVTANADGVTANILINRNLPDCLIDFLGMRDVVNKTFDYLAADREETLGFRAHTREL